MTDHLRLYWLYFLRYANVIDLYSAKQSGNTNELAWCRLKISDLDRQIDNLSMSIVVK